MIDRTLCVKPPTNLRRRKVLQGAAAIIAGSVPVVSAGISVNGEVANLSGKLVCNISDPVKTLVLRNHSDQTVVIDHFSNSALMFDGGIVDCNNAFIDQTVAIPPNQEVGIRFAKRHPRALVHRVEDYQRVQSRVTRLSDGTRVIPFTATVHRSGANFV